MLRLTKGIRRYSPPRSRKPRICEKCGQEGKDMIPYGTFSKQRWIHPKCLQELSR